MSEDIIKIIITYGGGAFAIISFIVVVAVYFGAWKEKVKGVDKLSDNVYKLTAFLMLKTWNIYLLKKR